MIEILGLGVRIDWARALGSRLVESSGLGLAALGGRIGGAGVKGCRLIEACTEIDSGGFRGVSGAAGAGGAGLLVGCSGRAGSVGSVGAHFVAVRKSL